MAYNLINFGQETLHFIDQYNITYDDIDHVNINEKIVTFDVFMDFAKKIYYYPGFKGNKCINLGIKIIGKSGWEITRYQYDSQEKWEYKKEHKRVDKNDEITIKDLLASFYSKKYHPSITDYDVMKIIL